MTTTAAARPPLDPPARPLPPPPFRDVLDMIGNTPMIELRRLDTGICRLFGKLEFMNPAGSVKDRIGKRMIEEAERRGLLEPGGTIVEATAGNTGLALALVAARKGYQLKMVVPDKMSQEKIDHLKAMGAKVILTRSDVEKGHPAHYMELAKRIADETGAFYPNQFANEANVAAHYEGTGPEIWEQMEGKIDAAVFGVGTGGTLVGTSRFLREKNPSLDVVLGDPKGSILAPLVTRGERRKPGSWLVEGIGEDFIPGLLDLGLVTKAYEIGDGEAFRTARELLHAEGIFAGSSSGVLVAAALRYCREQTAAKRVVTLIPDTGNKYLRKMYSDFWMTEQGLVERERVGDLRDLIARRHLNEEDYTVSPTDPLSVAQGRMKLYDVSQLPVCVNGRIVGIIDESDILLTVNKDPVAFRSPVSDHMVTKLETLSPQTSMAELVPIFRAGKVALIADEKNYYGLITQVDLLGYLRRQAK